MYPIQSRLHASLNSAILSKVSALHGRRRFDRAAALKQFDEYKTGVRGLIESGSAAATLPPIFRHPILRRRTSCPSGFSVPTVDLSLPRAHLVGVVASAAREWGFFQIVNHDLPLQLLDGAVSAVRSFHELPPDERSKVYSRSMAGGVSYSSNVDLYQSVAASWRDTVQIMMGPTRPDPDQIPAVCREEVLAFDEGATAVAGMVMSLLSEGLELTPERLEAALRLKRRLMVCHYYPPCPEPEQTVGTAEHTDPGVLTVLLQDSVGGLQVKWTGKDGEEAWVDVEPVQGALVINVGDLLQIISNDVYKSVEHRVLANSHQEARVSIGIFFNPAGNEELYGPLPELILPEKPALYRRFTMSEFMKTFFSKQLGTLVDNFKL